MRQLISDNLYCKILNGENGQQRNSYMTGYNWLTENMWRINASVKYAIIGSDNGLLPARRQAILWTSTGLLLIGPWATNVSEIWIKIINIFRAT